jgi:hypothetical protein
MTDIFDLERMRVHAKLPVFDSPHLCVAFHPTSATLVVTVATNQFYLYDVESRWCEYDVESIYLYDVESIYLYDVESIYLYDVESIYLYDVESIYLYDVESVYLYDVESIYLYEWKVGGSSAFVTSTSVLFCIAP